MAKNNFHPVILAGGRGTRFWPLSRKRHAKQLLVLNGKRTMIEQTVARLSPLAPAGRFWVITNEDSQRQINRLFPRLPKRQVLAEPVARNTAPAIGLAAFLLLKTDPKAILGLFPSDHVIADKKRFVQVSRRGIQIAASGENIVVFGIPPRRPETGYGYIETGIGPGNGFLRVRRFTEKPDAERAAGFLAAGNYFWNSGMFLWSARTLTRALQEHLPETAAVLEQIASAHGTPRFAATFRRLYPKCENVSIDYAVLEPRSAKGEDHSNIFCLEADFGWNDLGSWTALHEHLIATLHPRDANVVDGSAGFLLDATDNYVHAPGKFIALVGVKNLVIVETEDALLVTNRERAQDVGKVVKYLDQKKLTRLV